MNRKQLLILTCLLVSNLVTGGIPSAKAQSATFNDPTYDRWNYPFNASNPLGSRTTASVFGATGTPGVFDDRDAQFLVAFDTSGQYTTGLGVGNYDITQITLTLEIATVSTGVFYDDTYDAFGTYVTPSNPLAMDGDAGRPFELYGVGYRTNFGAVPFPAPYDFNSFGEDGTYAFADPTSEDVRSVFAQDFDGTGTARDVSNNVRDGFDPNAFAIGTTSLTPGAQLTTGTKVEFDVNLADSDIYNYVQEGLNAGNLSFMVTGLQETSQMSPTNASFYTKEGGTSSQSATLEVIPEPTSFSLFMLGGGFLALMRRLRSRK